MTGNAGAAPAGSSGVPAPEDMRAFDALLIEWREAREAIFQAPEGGTKPEMWTRLGHAEVALMRFARGLPGGMYHPDGYRIPIELKTEPHKWPLVR